MLDKIIDQQLLNMLKRLVWENYPKFSKFYNVAIIAMIIVAATTAMSAWIIRDVVNAVIGSDDISLVVGVSASIVAIFAIKGLATYVQVYFLRRAGNGIIADVQNKVYGRLVKQGLAYFQQHASSQMLINMTNNAQAARSAIDTLATSMVRDLLTLFGLLFVLIYSQPGLSMIVIIAGPLVLLGVRLLLKQVRGIMKMELTSLAMILQIMQETSTGIRIVKAFSLENSMKEKMNEAVRSVESRANNIARLEAATSPLVETIAGFAIAGVVLLSGYRFLSEGGSSDEIARLMQFIVSMLLAYEPAKRLARVRVTLEANMVGVRMMYSVLDHPINLSEKPDAIDLAANANEVRLKDVEFGYKPGLRVLNKINLTCEAGKMTALVGASGSGKSTVINLIMRMYDPTSGAVEIGGTNIKDITFKSLRDRISYVSQDTFLFDTTIRENIRLGRQDASDEQVVEAAKMANVHDFASAEPQGYDTIVGENGNKLSGGQKQRIAIARAMLRNSEILILDEATSSLDTKSEGLIREAIDRLTKNKTTIVIAHRLSTVARADKIVVLDQGQVVEEGTQAELLAKGDGAYSGLYEAQFRE